MSDGLKLIGAVISTGSASTLLGVELDMLLDTEVTVAEFVRGHFRSYRELPSAQTVFEETNVRLPVVSEPLQYYVDQVQDRHDYNLVRDRFAGLREGLQQRDMAAVSETVADMSRVLRRRRGGSKANEVTTIDDGLRMVSDRLELIKGTGGMSGVSAGWEQYDAITGGYQKGDLITIVARPSMGKTYCALRQAKAAHADGENVLFVTTEMGTEQLSRRYAALETGVNPSLLKSGNISTYMQRRIASLYSDMVGADRFRLFSVGMNSKTSAIEGLCQEFGPSIIFIDGVYLMKPTEGARNFNRTERITAVYDELKALTLDADIPVIALSQFNRQAGKGGKEGTLETIGFTDAIGTHSSVVVAIKDGPTQDPKASRTLDFLKGREGETGEIAINFKFAPLDMSEMTQEDREGEGGVAQDAVGWMGRSQT